MREIKDLTGKKFGHLVVMGYAGKKSERTAWNCRCDCGNEVVVLGVNLNSGNTKSCGCHKYDVVDKFKTHGKSKTRIYRIWRKIKERCEKDYCKEYERYGARGISLCNEWYNFMSFYNWSMLNGYRDDLTIDRIDNDKGYSPDNCRWVDILTQQNNRRNNIKYEYDGKMLTIPEIARIVGMQPNTLYDRIHRYGYTLEQAITKKVRIWRKES